MDDGAEAVFLFIEASKIASGANAEGIVIPIGKPDFQVAAEGRGLK